MAKFIDSVAAEQLKYLDISHNFETITDQTMLHIKNSSHCSRLAVLKVANCNIKDIVIIKIPN